MSRWPHRYHAITASYTTHQCIVHRCDPCHVRRVQHYVAMVVNYETKECFHLVAFVTANRSAHDIRVIERTIPGSAMIGHTLPHSIHFIPTHARVFVCSSKWVNGLFSLVGWLVAFAPLWRHLISLSSAPVHVSWQKWGFSYYATWAFIVYVMFRIIDQIAYRIRRSYVGHDRHNTACNKTCRVGLLYSY